MTIKKTDLLALDWLKSQHEASEIDYQPNETPTIACRGKKYEPRHLYGKKLIFSKEQAKKLNPTDIILVFSSNKLIGQFKWGERSTSPYKVQIVETDKATLRINRALYNRLIKLNIDIEAALSNLASPAPNESISDAQRVQELKLKLCSGLKGQEYRRTLEEYRYILAKNDHFNWRCRHCNFEWHSLKNPTRCPACYKPLKTITVRDFEREYRERRA